MSDEGQRVRLGVRLVWVAVPPAGALAVVALVLGGASRGIEGAPPFGAIEVVRVLGVPFLTGIGVVIARRRPTNPIGWLFVAVGLVASLRYVVQGYAAQALAEGQVGLAGAELAAWLELWVLIPAAGLLSFALLLFPDGRLPTPRWRWCARLVGVAAAGMTAIAALASWPGDRVRVLDRVPREAVTVDSIGGALAVLLVAVGAASLVVRFRRAGNMERLQLKWFALAAVMFTIAAVLQVTRLGPTIVPLIAEGVAILALPLAVAVAILRYRLYEIERIISRTVSYGLLVAVLGLVYAGGVLGVGSAVSGLTGQEDSDLVVAASVLVVVALFGPVRSRVQRAVDRRFNRSGYEARRAVDSFAAELRDEVDPEELSRGVATTAAAVVQPAAASLWLAGREDGR